MARARLHLICGNCGYNDMWSYRIAPEGTDIDGELFPAVYLSCGNCATLQPQPADCGLWQYKMAIFSPHLTCDGMKAPWITSAPLT